MVRETQPVTIGDQLRFVLFGLECVLDAEFPADVAEKIFSDCEEDAVSEKRYVLRAAKHQKVFGYVQDYEPGDIWLTVETAKALSPSLSSIVERARYQVYRRDKQHDR